MQWSDLRSVHCDLSNYLVYGGFSQSQPVPGTIKSLYRLSTGAVGFRVRVPPTPSGLDMISVWPTHVTFDSLGGDSNAESKEVDGTPS